MSYVLNNKNVGQTVVKTKFIEEAGQVGYEKKTESCSHTRARITFGQVILDTIVIYLGIF